MERRAAHLCLAAAMLTVGSTVIASRIIGRGLAPLTATALRFAMALPLFLLLMRLTGTRFPRPQWRDALLLLAQAGLGSVGYTVLLIAGTQLTAASDAGIMIGTLPAFTALFATVLLRERPSAAIALAISLATLGVVLVTLQSSNGAGHHSLTGDALVLGAVLCESCFILLNKRLTVPLPPLALSTVMAGLGLVVSLPWALADLLHHSAALPLSSLLGVAYYAVIPTVIGFWLWYAGSARVAGTEAAIFTAVAPVSAVLLARAIFGDPLSPARLGGLALVLVAIVIVGYRDLPAYSRRARARSA